MMLNTQPKLADLHDLIKKIKDYPVSASEVADTAKREHADKNVIDFYRAFPDDAVFVSREDLTARSEQVEMLNQESGQPPEIFTAPEED